MLPGKDPEAALPSFRSRHRVHACGALDIFPLRALDVDQIAISLPRIGASEGRRAKAEALWFFEARYRR
jgi:hypothetical protein